MDEVEIAERLRGVEERSKSNTRRVDALEKNQEALNSMASSIAVMVERQKTMESSVDAIKEDVSALKQLPADRWNSVSEKLIVAFLGGVLGYLLPIIFQ